MWVSDRFLNDPTNRRLKTQWFSGHGSMGTKGIFTYISLHKSIIHCRWKYQSHGWYGIYIYINIQQIGSQVQHVVNIQSSHGWLWFVFYHIGKIYFLVRNGMGIFTHPNQRNPPSNAKSWRFQPCNIECSNCSLGGWWQFRLGRLTIPFLGRLGEPLGN